VRVSLPAARTHDAEPVRTIASLVVLPAPAIPAVAEVRMLLRRVFTLATTAITLVGCHRWSAPRPVTPSTAAVRFMSRREFSHPKTALLLIGIPVAAMEICASHSKPCAPILGPVFFP
jgi:hypothetical protein